MKILVSNLIYLKQSDLTQAHLLELQGLFTRKNPMYGMLKRQKIDTKDVEEYIKSYFVSDGFIAIPRGAGEKLKSFLYKRGYQFTAQDNRTTHPEIDIEMRFGVEMGNGRVFESFHDYQKNAISALTRRSNGIFKARCGGGKTVTGIGVITTIKQPTLILVHTGDLLSQWHGELAEKTRGDYSFGQYGLGTRTVGDVTIATLQTLSKLPSTELLAFMRRFGLVMLDECHHCPASTFDYVMNHATAKYRFGLTATNSRGDGLWYKAEETIGPIAYAAEKEQIQTSGIIADTPLVTIVDTQYGDGYYQTMRQRPAALNRMAQHRGRNNLILSLIVNDWRDGRFPLIISQRVAHCKFLFSELEKHGMVPGLLIGEIASSKRKETIRKANEGLIDCIIGTNVADEGLNIPNLDTIHIVLPHANKTKLEQQIGRIERKGGQRPLVRHYRDLGKFAQASNEFLRYCRGWGFEIQQGFDDSSRVCAR